MTARARRAPWLLILPGLLFGCAPTLAPLPDVGCRLEEANSDPTPAPLPKREPNTAGQMSEGAARAKRLFDAERWAEAEPALRAVMNGSTGDDAGNRELAQYHLAIALLRLARPADALAELEAIALDPAHLKHAEVLLWLTKLFVDPRFTVRTVRLIGLYEESYVQRFDNPQQRDLYQTLSLALGRARFRAGDWEGAGAALARVPAGSRWYVAARQCQEHIRAVAPGRAGTITEQSVAR